MKHTGIYVDLGYKDMTTIAVIKKDILYPIITLVPQTEFEDVVATVVSLIRKYDINAYSVKSHGFPALEHRIQSMFKKEYV